MGRDWRQLLRSTGRAPASHMVDVGQGVEVAAVKDVAFEISRQHKDFDPVESHESASEV